MKFYTKIIAESGVLNILTNIMVSAPRRNYTTGVSERTTTHFKLAWLEPPHSSDDNPRPSRVRLGTEH